MYITSSSQKLLHDIFSDNIFESGFYNMLNQNEKLYFELSNNDNITIESSNTFNMN